MIYTKEEVKAMKKARSILNKVLKEVGWRESSEYKLWSKYKHIDDAKRELDFVIFWYCNKKVL